jgi:hypothetical protein
LIAVEENAGMAIVRSVGVAALVALMAAHREAGRTGRAAAASCDRGTGHDCTDDRDPGAPAAVEPGLALW